MKEFDKKYRPKTLDEIVGQKATVDSIKQLLKSNRFPHSFLFTGPSGVGKTTIARVIASLVDAADIIEVDGASYTGVDDMREIADNLKYRSFIGNGIKFLILDESHMLSKNAWNSWLKIVEEPPEHVYFAFCTTEPTKVPKTIKTRCHAYQLPPLSSYEILTLIRKVCNMENLNVDSSVLEFIAKESEGSARQALVYLSQMNSFTLDEAKTLIESYEGDQNAIKLCRLLINEASQVEILKALKDIKDLNPYSLKIQIINYLTGCVLNSNNFKDTKKFLLMLEIFNNTSMDQNAGFAAIVLAANEVHFKQKN